MSEMIFVNLPVRDLAAARRFYEAIGAVNEPKFTDETAAAMKFSDTIFFMLLTHEKYRSFTPLPIADAREKSAVMLALSRTAAMRWTPRSAPGSPRGHRRPGQTAGLRADVPAQPA